MPYGLKKQEFGLIENDFFIIASGIKVENLSGLVIIIKEFSSVAKSRPAWRNLRHHFFTVNSIVVAEVVCNDFYGFFNFFVAGMEQMNALS